jgi:hypothetical protein
MALNLTSGYEDLASLIQETTTYKRTKNDYDGLISKQGNKLSDVADTVQGGYQNAIGKTKKFEEVQGNQIDKLLKIAESLGPNLQNKAQSSLQRQIDKVNFSGVTQNTKFSGLTKNLNSAGASTVDFIKKSFKETIVKIEPQVQEIINKEVLRAIGCSQNQTYPTNNEIYIKVSSIDIFGNLKQDSNDPIGKLYYELGTSFNNNVTKNYPMNRQLNHRLNNPGLSFNSEYGSAYRGTSLQELFDFVYTKVGPNGETGDYFKITLKERIPSVSDFGSYGTSGFTQTVQSVERFIVDYYKKIRIAESRKVFSEVMNILTNVLTIGQNPDTNYITNEKLFGKIIQRIFGQCQDNTSEIGVSGIAKISVGDEFDESFFELTPEDNIEIEKEISNIQRGVVQFEGCGAEDFPVDSTSIVNSLLKMNDATTTSEEIELSDQSEDAALEQWKLLYPKFPVISWRKGIIKSLVQALCRVVFSPKAIFPLMIMLKALGNNVSDTVEDVRTFMTKFRLLVTNISGKLFSLFVKELYKIISRDIKKLLGSIVTDLLKEKIDKRYAIYVSLLQAGFEIRDTIRDFRRCKSVIDNLIRLFKIIDKVTKPYRLPLLALDQAALRPGVSATRAFMKNIGIMQELGLPTGNLPDGSPNLDLVSQFANIKAMYKEQDENGQVEISLNKLVLPVAVPGLAGPGTASGAGARLFGIPK